MIAATITSTPVASQTGTNRAATTAVATNEEKRPPSADEATSTVRSGVLTKCRIQRAANGKGKPQAGVHSEQMGSAVSTIGERPLPSALQNGGAPQNVGFATMAITIRTRSAVSKRKTVKSRFTRLPTSGEVGPCSAAALSIRPSSGPTNPTPTIVAIAQPAMAKSIQNVPQPQLPFSTSTTPSAKSANRVGV